MSKNISKGKAGEDLAAEFLIKRGFNVIERNWRYSRYGEIDIIAFDREILVFIEVKARTSNDYGHPIEAINQNKVNKIRTIAGIYLNEKEGLKYKGVRFDAVCIILKNIPEITYFKDIF